MNGIASLPQGSNMPQGGPPQGMPQQAPGQAAPGQMPGIPMPQAQGTPMGVTSLIPPLKQLNVQQLQMELMNPGSQLPKFAVLSALDQKIKEQKAMQAVMGMQAQQQNAQDPGTVAQQVMQAAQQPVMARHGGVMHSYRQGGIVGFSQGGGATSYPVKEQPSVQTQETQDREAILSALEKAGMNAAKLAAAGYDVATLPVRALAGIYNTLIRAPRAFGIDVPFIPKEFGQESLTPMMDRIRRKEQAANDQAEAETIGVGLPSMTPEAARVDVTQGPLPPTPGAPPERLLDTRSIPAPSAAPPVAPITAPTGTPQAAPQTRPQAASQAAAPSDYDARIKELQGAIGAQNNLPPELLKSQQGLAALVEQQIADRERRANEIQEMVRKQYEAAQEEKKFGPMDWFALAGGISTEKGQLMGSLGRATAGVMGAKKAALKEAQKIYNEAQALDRRERDAIGQMRILEGQRQLALKQSRYDEANRLEIEIKKLSVEAAKYGAERQDKQREIEIAEERNRIAREGVEVQRISATRPTADIQFREWLRSPENKKLEEEIQSARRAEDRQIKLYELYGKRPITAGEMSFEDFIIEFEKATGKASSTAGGPPPGAVRLKGQQ